MKKLFVAAAIAATTLPAFAADVGVSISIGEPGFYGRLDIGRFPAPQLIYAQPMVIRPAPGPYVEPIYLRVPPGHAKHWAKHCGRYNACGRPVYFVTDNWYNDVYAPRYREEHGHYGDGRRDDYDRRDHGGPPGHGHGHGKGHGHGRGHDRD